MIEQFYARKSRMFVFDQPVVCHICQHDVFLPYETYQDVEKPGIKVLFVHYTAICQQCGFVIELGDPSYYDAEADIYRWALNQRFIDEND